MKCLVIGGGIIGLSSAYYLHKAGHEVEVMDKTDMTDGCSYGNAGYVCPSHFIPMAAPNIISKGLKWMLSSSSPFYVKPRLNLALMRWGIEFIRHSNVKHMNASAIPLRDIALLSQQLVEEEWSSQPGFDFSYVHKGLLEIFQTEANAHHAHAFQKRALDLGLDITLLDSEELARLEPATRINAIGALFFKCDGSLYPNKLMKNLKDDLYKKGVRFYTNEEVGHFNTKGGLIRELFTQKGKYTADQFILATGSWSTPLAARLQVNIPVVPGRGYSVTMKDSRYRLNYPAILVEGRVAVSPMEAGTFRFGGTLEVTPVGSPLRMQRVAGIVHTLNRFFPEFHMPMPAEDAVWHGYRPCSADGLPYIGRLKNAGNCIVATGHSMLGLSLGAATGKLVSEIADEQPTTIDISAYSPDRFNH